MIGLIKLAMFFAVLISNGCMQPTVGAALSSARVDALMDLIKEYMQELNEARNEKVEASGTVKIMDVSSNRFEGTYTGNNGDGIGIVSEDDGTGKGKLSITTLQGETIFHAVQPQGSHASLVRVGNEVMLMHKGNVFEDASVSRVPLAYISMAETALEEDNKFTINLLKNNLEKMNEDEAIALLSKIQNDQTYIKNVVEAAHAIGSRGITGVDNNAARLFFMHAKNLGGILQFEDLKVSKSDNPDTTTLTMFGEATAQEQCTTFKTKCPAGSCPYKVPKNPCRGLCGNKCNCWWWTCGDCCVHRGCDEHDKCCGKSGWYAWVRCNAPIGFSCNGRFSC